MPTRIDTSGVPESFTRFPVRIHDEEPRIALGSATATKTFQHFTKASRTHSSGPYGNVCAMSYPEGDAERVKMCAEILEMFWIYDDVIESLPHDAASEEHNVVIRLLDRKNGDQDSALDADSISTPFQDVGPRMHALDPVGAPFVLSILKQFLREYDSSSMKFDTWEECLPFRVLNVAFRMMDALLQWTIGVYLSPEETELCSAFYMSAARTLGLTNDYFSWNMEQRRPTDRSCSTVPVVMKQYGMSERDALIFVKGLAVDAEETTMKLAIPLKELSSNVKEYVEGMEHLLGANCFWSATAPRYADLSDVEE
ncbi:Geranylgeranyl pyrophosphate synthase [Mycena sanguinolenta]|uniref:Geranylgeranyl pyrophosphate synthase n=1 Tax=Mycena sanguinolenta TaxID=230812 RepID=A0A8H7DC26_9AGAR|nr:Geranylgeranyl pyrophosphate synthase [Mycena sanguinolenta]